MQVNIMPCRYPLKRNQWPILAQYGFAAHGDTCVITQQPDNSDVHMFWGLKRRHGRQALENKKKCLITERAYLGDRFQWHALGFNDLNGYADFCNEDVEPDRWQDHWQSQMQPWDASGDYALLIGQVPGDASLRGVNQYDWAKELVPKLKEKYGKVVYRPHPNDKRNRTLAGAYTDKGLLAESMRGAKVVVTFSSNTGVDAIMAGKPVIAYNQGSMVYEVASHHIDDELIMPDREDWGRKIAYAQWLPHELKNGTAWGHLRPFVNKK